MADELRPRPPALDAVNMGGLESVATAWQTLANRAAAWPDGEDALLPPGWSSGEWQGVSGDRARDAGRDLVGVADTIAELSRKVVSAIGDVKDVVDKAVVDREAIVDRWRELCAQYPTRLAEWRAEAEASGDQSTLKANISRSEQKAEEFKSRLSAVNDRLDAAFDAAKSKLVSAQEALDSVANQCRGKRDALGDTTKIVGVRGELDAPTRAQLRALIGASRDPALVSALGAWMTVGVKDLIAYATANDKLDQATLDAAKAQYDAYVANPASAATSGSVLGAFAPLTVSLVAPSAGQWAELATYADDPLVDVDSALSASPPPTTTAAPPPPVPEAPTIESLGNRLFPGVDWATTYERERHTFGAGHPGIDFPFLSSGVPIHSYTSGTVVAVVRSSSGYGNHVIVEYGGGVTILYGHQATIDPGIVVGRTLLPGDVIGTVGSTGASSGLHLHLEVRAPNEKGGIVPVDPLTVPVL